MHALSRLAVAMGSAAGRRGPSGSPAVGRLRELFQGGGDAADGWEKSWEFGITPWDLGKPTPIIEHLAKSGTLPKGRALVPGCGTLLQWASPRSTSSPAARAGEEVLLGEAHWRSCFKGYFIIRTVCKLGYDVVALACPERFVVGLEISNIATEKAKKWSSSLPNADYFTFLTADFFKWRPSEPFDLIFDYTFFCALDPSLRQAWAETVNRLLKPEGELITLIYLISDQQGGPPYNNTIADYQKVLEPLGFKAVVMEDNELSIKPRKGCEKLGRWKRCGRQSSL